MHIVSLATWRNEICFRFEFQQLKNDIFRKMRLKYFVLNWKISLGIKWKLLLILMVNFKLFYINHHIRGHVVLYFESHPSLHFDKRIKTKIVLTLSSMEEKSQNCLFLKKKNWDSKINFLQTRFLKSLYMLNNLKKKKKKRKRNLSWYST